VYKVRAWGWWLTSIWNGWAIPLTPYIFITWCLIH
jgi:hypothetical protein